MTSFIQQFFTSRDNNANAETFVGQEGRLWFNPTTNQIYSSDGNTPGGIPLAGGSGGTPGGSNSQVQFNQAGTFGGTANLTINSATGALTAVSFVGDGAPLTNITGANVTGTVANATYATSAGTATTAATVTDAAQSNITSVGILTAVNTSGAISATGNITGSYFLGNGSQLTGIAASYGNANVVANLAALGSNPVSTTGNVSAGYFVGNGSLLTGLAATYSNTNATSLLASFGSNTISTTGNVTTGNLNITVDAVVTGNLTVNGTTTTVNSNTVTINDKFINVANNAATAAAANGGGIGVGPVGGEYATLTFNSTANAWNTNIPISATGNVTGGNILTTGLISAAGNIAGNYFIGNGSQLTGIASGGGASNARVMGYNLVFGG